MIYHIILETSLWNRSQPQWRAICFSHLFVFETKTWCDWSLFDHCIHSVKYPQLPPYLHKFVNYIYDQCLVIMAKIHIKTVENFSVDRVDNYLCWLKGFVLVCFPSVTVCTHHHLVWRPVFNSSPISSSSCDHRRRWVRTQLMTSSACMQMLWIGRCYNWRFWHLFGGKSVLLK